MALSASSPVTGILARLAAASSMASAATGHEITVMQQSNGAFRAYRRLADGTLRRLGKAGVRTPERAAKDAIAALRA